MKNNQKIMKAECSKKVEETAIDGSKKNSNECVHLTTLTHFDKGDEAYFKEDGGIILVSKFKDRLYKPFYFHDNIIEMEPEEFSSHFSAIA